MTETKHTPTQWTHRIQYGPEGEANYTWVYAGDGQMVGTFQLHHGVEVVKAVNSHTALVAALERAVNLATAMIANDPNEPVSDAGHTCLDLWMHELDQIRAALSAEGEKDAPKDERHMTLEERATFSQALRDSGTFAYRMVKP